MELKAYLQDNRWSVAKFAKAIDTNQNTVAKWVYYGVIPNKSQVLKIYQFTEYKVTPNDFYGVK